MKYLLIGGNGFIGSHVQDALLRRGHDVRVLDPVAERCRPPLRGVTTILSSPLDDSILHSALAGVDAVLYLASTSVPATSNAHPVRDLSSNLTPLVQTLDAMVRQGVGRLVYFSSGGTVYGVVGREPVSEDHPLDPVCAYGVVKVAAEKYIGMYARIHGLSSLILRPANPFGPRQSNEGLQGFVGTCLSRMAHGLPLHIWGDGSVVRDYLYVGDVAEAAALALESPHAGVINVGSGVGRSLLEVVDLLESITGLHVHMSFEPGRPFDVPCLVLSTSRATELLGWRAVTPIDAAVAAYWEYVRTTT